MPNVSFTQAKKSVKSKQVRTARVDIMDDGWLYTAFVYPKHWKGKGRVLGFYRSRSGARRAANRYLEQHNLIAA